MKKYIAILVISSGLCFMHLGAMKQNMPKKTTTGLSSVQEAELRRAVIDYKKGKQKEKASALINTYAQKYPNDALVKAKWNEKNRFDGGTSPMPVLKDAAYWEAHNKAMAEHYASYNRSDRSGAETSYQPKFVDAMGKPASYWEAQDRAAREHYGSYNK